MNETMPLRKCQRCGSALAPDAPEGLCPRCLMALNLAPQTEFPGADEGPGGTKFVPPPPPSIEEIGRLFPQLEIVECLGRGGMGVVYKARQPRLDRWVALKVISPGKEKNTMFAERFAREARSLARLSHPSIVTIHDFGEAGGLYFLLMEYVDGVNLRALLLQRKLAPDAALKIVPAICEALQYAHQQGVVHRDIKPENILLDKQGRVKIADFGIAKMVGPDTPEVRLTEDQQVVGTPNYMAPEQVEKPASVDHRADIYSLGVVFYEMLTGELPLGKFQPPSNKVQIDVRLDEVVLHALEKDPERRYQQAIEVKTALDTLGDAPAPRPEAVRAPAAPDPWAQVRGPAIGLIVTGILNWAAIPLILMAAAFIGVQSIPAYVAWVLPAVCFLGSGIILFAGFKMKSLEAWPLALVGAALAALITPGNLVGLPVGIWAWVVLLRSETRAAFAARAAGRLGPVSPRMAGAGGNIWKWAAAAGGLVFLVLAVSAGAMMVVYFTGLRDRKPTASVQVSSENAASAGGVSAEAGPGHPAEAAASGGHVAHPGAGIPAEPQRLRVLADGSGTHATLPAALEAAAEGAVIEIGPGRFEAPLVIRKAVSLLGAGASQTVIGPLQPLPAPSADALREFDRRVREARSEEERRRLREEFAAANEPPVLQIRTEQPVLLAGLRFTLPGVAPEGRLLSATVLQIQGGQVTLRECAIVGSPGNAVTIGQGARVQIQRCLVAAAWNTGIQIERASPPGQVTILDSDIRNCHYAGIVARAENVEILRCRISGAAWHGIRYDNVSPLIQDCLVFGNARSGVYASGRTEARIFGNAFWKNEMTGLSAWFSNRDQIQHNTFAENRREGLAILGASEPRVQANLFWSNPAAIVIGDVNDPAETSRASGRLHLRDSLFWTNGSNIVFTGAAAAKDPSLTNRLALGQFPGCQELDPQFRSAAAGDFSVRAGAATSAGAPNPQTRQSPWPLQPEEQVIIPEGDTRDSRAWRRGPASQ